MTRQNKLKAAGEQNEQIMRSVDGKELLDAMMDGAMGRTEVSPTQVALMKDLRSCLVPTLQNIAMDVEGELGITVNIIKHVD